VEFGSILKICFIGGIYMANRVLGFDVSVWQDNNGTIQQIDFNKMKKNGGEFVYIRSILAKIKKDEDFDYNWRESKKAGLLRGSYCFCDYRYKAVDVATAFIKELEKDKGELPPSMDIEELVNVPFPSRYTILQWMEQFSKMVESKMGIKPVLYTSPKYINAMKPIPDWLLEHDLWIAHYLLPFYMAMGNSPAFNPWKKYIFWQWTDRENGIKYGVESKQIDADYFNGDLMDLYNYSEKYVGKKPVTEYTLEQKVEKLWNAHPELH